MTTKAAACVIYLKRNSPWKPFYPRVDSRLVVKTPPTVALTQVRLPHRACLRRLVAVVLPWSMLRSIAALCDPPGIPGCSTGVSFRGLRWPFFVCTTPLGGAMEVLEVPLRFPLSPVPFAACGVLFVLLFTTIALLLV